MRVYFTAIVATLICGLASTVTGGPVLVSPADYTGYRTSASGGGVISTGGRWADLNGGVRITWNITRVDDVFTYQYTIGQRNGAALAQGAVSHFILETSTNFTTSDIFPGSSPATAPQTWGPSGSNPYIPGNIFGIKFDFGSLNPTYTLVTKRVPVWGDWYSKDGRAGPGSFVNTARNAGFGSDDQSAPFTGWIPTPDTLTTMPVVPLPAAAWMGVALIGSLGAANWLRRRNAIV